MCQQADVVPLACVRRIMCLQVGESTQLYVCEGDRESHVSQAAAGITMTPCARPGPPAQGSGDGMFQKPKA